MHERVHGIVRWGKCEKSKDVEIFADGLIVRLQTSAYESAFGYSDGLLPTIHLELTTG